MPALRAPTGAISPRDRFDVSPVAISPQCSAQSVSTAEKAGPSFTGLSDSASRLARKIRIDFQQADDVLAARQRLGPDLAQVTSKATPRLTLFRSLGGVGPSIRCCWRRRWTARFNGGQHPDPDGPQVGRASGQGLQTVRHPAR